MSTPRPATLALLALACCSSGASAIVDDDEHGPPRAGTVGLLEWKLIGSPLARECSPALEAQPLFDGPQGSQPVAWIEPARADPRSAEGQCTAPLLRDLAGHTYPLPLREHGYEEISMMVSAVATPAYRVAAERGWMWVVAGQDAVYRSYESLLPDRLTYLTPSFDGLLCPSPQDDAACIRLATLPDTEQRAVRVLSQQRQSEALWLQVEVLDGWCAENDPVVLARGWIRGFDTAQRVSVWFHSRGC